jgi:hypothetical protein
MVGAVAACQGSTASTPHVTRTASTASPGGDRTDSTTTMATPASGAPGATTGPGGCSIAAPASALSGLTLFVCFTISGAVSSSGGFIDADQGAGALSCADWAQHGEQAAGSSSQALQAPDPGDAQVTANGQALGFDLAIVPYSGPGSYASTSVAQSVSLGDSLSWSNNNTSGATFSAQVKSDGSGSLMVTHLVNDSSTGGTEDALESWVCVMEPGS